MKLGGIIYLQNIAERRMEGASRRNLEMFQQLCGTDALSRVILGTTNWGEVSQVIGERRENELKSRFWREMMESGSTAMRFKYDRASALNILSTILRNVQDTKEESASAPILQIQHELVDKNQRLQQTAAGKKLLYSLQEVYDMRKDSDAWGEEDEEKMKNLKKQMKSLKLPMTTRILAAIGF
jgi:hypothetical protein